MPGFRDIIGHQKTIEHLKNSISSGKVSHAYLFVGEAGMGRKTLAMAYAQALQCETLQRDLDQKHEEEKAALAAETAGSGDAAEAAGPPVPGGGQAQNIRIDACGRCPSCLQAQTGNHPDIITWRHAKEKTFSVDDVRGLVSDVQIRPYSSHYKIYIVPDAQLMTPQAQNALLKTLEEPPDYAVILLLAESADAMLETIRSRCIVLTLQPVQDAEIRRFLRERQGTEEYQAEICTAFAQGNVGRALKLSGSHYFQEMLENAVRILTNIRSWDLPEIMAAIRQMTSDNVDVDDVLDLFTVWYRDILFFKATRDVDGVVFREQIMEVRQAAQTSSYDGIQTVLEAIQKAKVRLKANVSFELAMELLLLTMKEN